MTENLKALQKKEAIERLKILHDKYKLMNTVIQEFKKEDTIYYSEYVNKVCPAILYWASNREDLVKLIKKFENEHQALVYHTILTPTFQGAYFTLLYITYDQEEWKRDKEDLKAGLPLAYCINLADPQMAEFGGVQIAGAMGGIVRLA